MPPAAAWVVVSLIPTALGWAVLGGVRLYRWYAGRPSPGSGVAQPIGRPIEQLSADLRRLHTALEEAENETAATPFKATRLRALRGAYLDVLLAACQRLEVPPPAMAGGRNVPLTEIYRAEAALRERGLDVRQPTPG